MDPAPKTWREVWAREQDDPTPDPLVEMAKRKRHLVDAARDAADHAARHAADPLPRLTPEQAIAVAEELAERAREVVEEWRSSREYGPMTLCRSMISLKRTIESAARGQEPVEPAATVEG